MIKKVKELLRNVTFQRGVILLIAFLAIECVVFSDFKGKLSSVWPGFPWWVVALFCAVSVLVASALFGIYFIAKKHKWGYDKIFLVLATLIGSLYILIAPLGSGNDDLSHYCRIYEISQGRLVSDVNGRAVGGNLPKEAIELIRDLNEKKTYSALFSTEDVGGGAEEFYNYSNTALYSPISYIPQVTGALIGRAIGASPIWIGTLARIFNLVFYILICLIGFKLMPRFKCFFLFLLLSPSIMSNATSLSADAFVVSLIFLFVAIILLLREERSVINWKHATVLCVVAILIAGCKITYLPVVLLILVLRRGNFKTKKFEILMKLMCVLFSVLVGIIWMKVASGLLVEHYSLAGAQVDYILRNPLHSIVVFVRTMLSSFASFAENMFSTSNAGLMYADRLILYSFVRWSFVILAVLALFNEAKRCMLGRKERLYFWIISMLVIAAIAGALYVQWTPQHCGNKVDCDSIIGMQGRYFIPVAIVGVSAIGRIKHYMKRDALILCFMALQLFTMTSMVTAFLG